MGRIVRFDLLLMCFTAREGLGYEHFRWNFAEEDPSVNADGSVRWALRETAGIELNRDL